MNTSRSLSTYDSARGLSLGRHSELLSMSHAELSARDTFPFLDTSASSCVEAALFFLPPSGAVLLDFSSSSSSVGEEWILASSDVTSELPLRQRPLLVSLAYLSGAW